MCSFVAKWFGKGSNHYLRNMVIETVCFRTLSIL
jgi:hypothetical protein